MIFTITWQGLGVILFLGAIGMAVWCWRDASRKTEVGVMRYLPTEKRDKFNKKKNGRHAG